MTEHKLADQFKLDQKQSSKEMTITKLQVVELSTHIKALRAQLSCGRDPSASIYTIDLPLHHLEKVIRQLIPVICPSPHSERVATALEGILLAQSKSFYTQDRRKKHDSKIADIIDGIIPK